MESVVDKYCRLIDLLEQRLKSKPDYKNRRDKQISHEFNNYLLREIQKLFRIKIIKDNQFAAAINEKTKIVENNFKKNFKASEQKLMFLHALNRISKEVNFISKRQFDRNNSTFKAIRNHPEFRLNSELDILASEDNREDFRRTFFYDVRKEDDINIEDEEEVNKYYQEFYREIIKEYDRRLVIKIDEIISKYENKQEILSQELLAAIDEYLGNQIGKNDQEIQLNKLLTAKAESASLASNKAHSAKMNQQYDYLKGILNKFCSMKLIQNDLKLQLHLAVFGSNVSGFASKDTDMDLTILTNCYINETSFLKYLHKFLEAQFRDKDKNSYKLEFVEARIPLIKLKFMNNDFQFHFDIIVNNILGVINSKFLAVYGQIKWIKHLIILVKQWGKHQSLIQENLFSSYGLTLMVLHFLIATNRINYIMDERTRSPQAPHFVYQRTVRGNNQQFKVYYEFKTNPKDVTSLKRVNLYEILCQFFEYYYEGQETCGNHWKISQNQRIITVSGGLCQYDDTFIFTIKDPFDQSHNPGRVRLGEKNKVMGKFYNALLIMQSRIKQDIQGLFDEF